MPTSQPLALDRQRIDYTDADTQFEGYAVFPAHASAALPCVVLAHDWSGLTAPTEALAERYAGLGYICFALDAYGKNMRGDPLGDNARLMNPLMQDRAVLQQRLLAGFNVACQLPGVDAARMAAVGYCFGGLCALDLARAAPANLLAAVSFHGALARPEGKAPRPINARVLLLHGWEDPVAPPADVLAIARELTEAGADWQLHAYGHALHAFTFDGANFPERGIVYDHAPDARSWAAMRQHLSWAFK